MSEFRRRTSDYARAVAAADAAIDRPPARGWRDEMLEASNLGELQQAWRDMDAEERKALMHATIRKAAGKAAGIVRLAAAPPRLAPGRTVNIDPAERARQIEALYRAMSLEERVEFDRSLVAP